MRLRRVRQRRPERPTSGSQPEDKRRPPVNVVGYVRVSTAEQADSGAGLEAQRAAISAEAERRGWRLVQVYEDAGASGKSLNGRPGLQEALQAVETGEAEAL